MKTNFHNKNFALSLTFTMRFKATRKRPITFSLLLKEAVSPILVSVRIAKKRVSFNKIVKISVVSTDKGQ